MRWIDEVMGQNGDGWDLNVVISVHGTETVALRLTGMGAILEDDDHAIGELLPQAPGNVLGAWDGELPAWPSASPPLFSWYAHVPGADDWLGLARQGDALVLWHYFTDEEAETPATWTRVATIQLAPDAQVTPR